MIGLYFARFNDNDSLRTHFTDFENSVGMKTRHQQMAHGAKDEGLHLTEEDKAVKERHEAQAQFPTASRKAINSHGQSSSRTLSKRVAKQYRTTTLVENHLLQSSNVSLWSRPRPSPHRWERMDITDRPWRAWRTVCHNWSMPKFYLSYCLVSGCHVNESVIEDSEIHGSTITNCHVRFTRPEVIEKTKFQNCIISAAPGVTVCIHEEKAIVGCIIEGHVVIPGPSKSVETADKLNETAFRSQLAPYEVHTNIVFKPDVLDCLRRWVYRFKRSREMGGTRTADYSIFRSWLRNNGYDEHMPSAKALGKRPHMIDHRYNVQEQLDLPLRRLKLEIAQPRGRRERYREVVDLMMNADETVSEYSRP